MLIISYPLQINQQAKQELKEANTKSAATLKGDVRSTASASREEGARSESILDEISVGAQSSSTVPEISLQDEVRFSDEQ